MSITDIAMENCHRHSEFSHQNNCEFPELCKRLAHCRAPDVHHTHLLNKKSGHPSFSTESWIIMTNIYCTLW